MTRCADVVTVIGSLTAAQQKVLERYKRNLSHDRDPMVWDDAMEKALLRYAKHPAQVQRAIHDLKKRGFTQTRYEYKQIVDQMQRFTLPQKPNRAWMRTFAKAKADLIDVFKKAKLRTLKYSERTDFSLILPRTDTHAGFIWVETGLKYKGDYLGKLYPLVQQKFEEARKAGTFALPIIMASRTKSSSPYDEWMNPIDWKCSTRMVHVVDLRLILCELRYAKPIQQFMSRLDWYAGGKDDAKIHGVIRRYIRGRTHWLSIDYSKYDSSIPSWLIRESFDIVEAAFAGDKHFDKELFDIMVNDFIHKVFIDGHGNLIEAHKGVPSGSMFTQIIDTIANKLMIDTYMHSKGITNYDMIIMGDDNLITSVGEIDKTDLASYLSHNFGVIVNDDKSSGGDVRIPPEFLSRKWTPAGVFRNPYECIAKLLCPERFREYRRKGFSPLQVMDAYCQTFPLGMRMVVDISRVKSDVRLRKRRAGTEVYLTGLMRYRALYLNSNR